MVEYKEFRVGDLFEFTSIRQIPRGFSPVLYDGGDYPYVTQKATDNGVTGFMDEVDELELISKPMIIMGVDNIANGVCYWLDEPFYANKMIGISNTNLNRRSAQYIITALLSAYKGYSYTDKISKRIVEDTWVELPSTAFGTPDFDFMENYIKEIEQKHIKGLESDLATRTENLLAVIGREDLIGDPDGLAAVVDKGFDDSGVEYAEFRVGDLFDVKSTKKTIHKNMLTPQDMVGPHPYITRTTQNNGLSGYIDYDDDYLNDANTISLGLDTYTLSYQATPYFTGNKVKILHLKNKELNSRIAMYLISAYNKMFQGYDWGTGINQQAIVNMRLNLPTTPLGTPDFDYMEQYIAHIELKFTHTLMQWTKAKELL